MNSRACLVLFKRTDIERFEFEENIIVMDKQIARARHRMRNIAHTFCVHFAFFDAITIPKIQRAAAIATQIYDCVCLVC